MPTRENKSGKLIVIEGACDGIGKTTQYNLLKNYLTETGVKLTTHHFPTYYAYQGKPVEMYLSGKYGKPQELSPYFIHNLYAQDRAITWHMKLQQAYHRGHTILLDRYTTSSIIYQSATFEKLADRKKFINYVIDFEYHKLGVREPDQVIFLHAPFDLVTKMIAARSENEGDIENDVYERDQVLMRQIYEHAVFVADYLGWEIIECADKSGKKMLAPETIHREIRCRLK